jgi:hypothetical protein
MLTAVGVTVCTVHRQETVLAGHCGLKVSSMDISEHSHEYEETY